MKAIVYSENQKNQVINTLAANYQVAEWNDNKKNIYGQKYGEEYRFRKPYTFMGKKFELEVELSMYCNTEDGNYMTMTVASADYPSFPHCMWNEDAAMLLGRHTTWGISTCNRLAERFSGVMMNECDQFEKEVNTLLANIFEGTNEAATIGKYRLQDIAVAC